MEKVKRIFAFIEESITIFSDFLNLDISDEVAASILHFPNELIKSP